MSQHLYDLLNENKDHLSVAETEYTKNALKRGAVSYLNATTEEKFFVIYRVGKSLSEIAQMTSHPISVIVLTACRYDWFNKKKLLGEKTEAEMSMDMLKSTAMLSMIATYLANQEEIASILSGKLKAGESKLAAKSPKDFADLMKNVATLNNIELGNQGNKAANIIVNNNNAVVTDTKKIEASESKNLLSSSEGRMKLLESVQEGEIVEAKD